MKRITFLFAFLLIALTAFADAGWLVFPDQQSAQAWIAEFQPRYFPDKPKDPSWSYAAPVLTASGTYAVPIIDLALPFLTASEAALIVADVTFPPPPER